VALLPRATPSIVFFLLIEPLVQVLAKVVAELEDLLNQGKEPTSGFALLVLGLTVGALAVPPLGGCLVSRFMRRFDGRGQTVIAVVVLALAVVVLAIEQATGLHEQAFWVSALVTVSGILLLLLLTYLGAGSILAWAARVAAQQVGAVGTLASKALPLLMIVILLSFFTAEVWQLVDPIYMNRTRLWGVVAFLAALGVLFLRSVVADEMKDMEQQRQALRADDLRSRLADTPFAGQVADDHHGRRNPLTHGERFNVVLVFFFAQAVQIVFFAFMVFCFFMVFGAIAVTDGLIEAWLTHPPDADGGKLFGLTMPVPEELVQVSIFLSAFSGLYFAGAAATDPLYREKFFDPLVADVRVSLAARDAYLGRWGVQRA
ncbi:MAG: hypothetical protein ACRDQB_00510, partial [Thermocrispum sp.]